MDLYFATILVKKLLAFDKLKRIMYLVLLKVKKKLKLVFLTKKRKKL